MVCVFVCGGVMSVMFSFCLCEYQSLCVCVCVCVCVTRRRLNAAVSLLCCVSRADPTVDHMPSSFTHTMPLTHRLIHTKQQTEWVFMDVTYSNCQINICVCLLHLESCGIKEKKSLSYFSPPPSILIFSLHSFNFSLRSLIPSFHPSYYFLLSFFPSILHT